MKMVMMMTMMVVVVVMVVMIVVLALFYYFWCVGKLRDAVACYERAIQLEPDTIENHKVDWVNVEIL
jgi:hypothetical protein